jgi:hypothetical protein
MASASKKLLRELDELDLKPMEQTHEEYVKYFSELRWEREVARLMIVCGTSFATYKITERSFLAKA